MNKNMKKIILHWTAGNHTPNKIDLEHYHFLIDGNGKCHTGKFKPKDNLNCYDGKYAQHTGGGNTNSIGIAMCGMMDYLSPQKIGSYPISKNQFEAFCKKIAEIAHQYKIPILKNTIMTHYEFGLNYPKSTSYGKIDITFLPPYPDVSACDIGDFIRTKIKWYFTKLYPNEP